MYHKPTNYQHVVVVGIHYMVAKQHVSHLGEKTILGLKLLSWLLVSFSGPAQLSVTWGPPGDGLGMAWGRPGDGMLFT